MTALELLGWATGLGFLAGIRLYATVLTLGLAVRFQLIDLRPEFDQLRVFGDWWVLSAAAVVFLVEFFADKVPWVDSLWDAIHTFIRPLGAAAVAVTALGDVSPALQVTAALLAGSVALGSHSAKAAARLAVNHSPEPVSNWVLSLAGDAIVPVGVWFTANHPLLVGGFVAVFLVVLLIVSPRLYRAVRLQMAVLGSLARHWLGLGTGVALPENHQDYLADKLDVDAPPEVYRGVVGKGVKGLRTSIGYLLLRDGEAIFVTRRWFRFRACRIPQSEQVPPRFSKGLLFDRVTLTDGTKTYRFDLFKGSGRSHRPSEQLPNA